MFSVILIYPPDRKMLLHLFKETSETIQKLPLLRLLPLQIDNDTIIIYVTPLFTI